MGLDMFLQGHEYHSNKEKTLDDFPIKEIIVELGYWRKHPDLHGAVVENFADGNDDCELVELSQQDVTKLIQLVKDGNLNVTTGFFFGQSVHPGSDEYAEQQTNDIKQLQNALRWLDTQSKDSIRWVTYRASW
jgi:hypothetical protein